MEYFLSFNCVQLMTPSSCTFDDDFFYILSLKEVNSGVRISATATNRDQCQNDKCSTSIGLLQSNHVYNLSIHSQNVFGISEASYLPTAIGI